jgi:hypothetical protein
MDEFLFRIIISFTRTRCNVSMMFCTKRTILLAQAHQICSDTHMIFTKMKIIGPYLSLKGTGVWQMQRTPPLSNAFQEKNPSLVR